MASTVGAVAEASRRPTEWKEEEKKSLTRVRWKEEEGEGGRGEEGEEDVDDGVPSPPIYECVAGCSLRVVDSCWRWEGSRAADEEEEEDARRVSIRAHVNRP